MCFYGGYCTMFAGLDAFLATDASIGIDNLSMFVKGQLNLAEHFL